MSYWSGMWTIWTLVTAVFVRVRHLMVWQEVWTVKGTYSSGCYSETRRVNPKRERIHFSLNKKKALQWQMGWGGLTDTNDQCEVKTLEQHRQRNRIALWPGSEVGPQVWWATPPSTWGVCRFPASSRWPAPSQGFPPGRTSGPAHWCSQRGLKGAHQSGHFCFRRHWFSAQFIAQLYWFFFTLSLMGGDGMGGVVANIFRRHTQTDAVLSIYVTDGQLIILYY